MPCLPICSSKVFARSIVWSDVWYPRMISTVDFSGTGFIKCMPRTFGPRRVTDAIRVMGIADVLAANTQSSEQILSIRL